MKRVKTDDSSTKVITDDLSSVLQCSFACSVIDTVSLA